MKKVLSFVLVLSLVLSSFSMAFAGEVKTAGLSDIAGAANEQAITVVNDLGIVTGYEDGTFKAEKAVKRAEFAVMLTKALNIPESALAGYTATSFTDVAGYEWAVPYLAFCESKGIMSGYGDGIVKPGNTITVNEAMTMALRAMGLTPNSAWLVGSWPANYVSIAQQYDLYDDVAAATTVDRGNAAQIIYNALTVGTFVVNAEGTTNLAAGKSMISALGCELADYNIVNYEEDSLIVLTDYVGALADIYMNKDGEVVAIDTVSTFLEGEFVTDGAVKFETEDVTYRFEANAITVTDTAVDLVNLEDQGTDYTSLVAALDATSGSSVKIAVEVSGKTITRVYSVAQWTVTDNNFADEFVQDEITKDQTLLGKSFATDKSNNIDLTKFQLLGAKSLDKIAEDDVVYVYTYGNDPAEDIVMVTVGTEVVEGKVTKEYVDEDGYQVYVIGGKDYYVSAESNADATINVKEEGTASLDYDGNIYKWETKNAASDNYAVVTGTYAAIGREATIVLLDKAGVEKEYVLANTTVATTATGLNAGDIVTFALDKNGKVEDLTQKVAYTAKNLSGEKAKDNSVIGTYAVDKGIVVFAYDANDDEYSLAKIADVKTKLDLNTVTHGAVVDDNKVLALVIDDSAFGASNETYGIITKNDAFGIDADDTKVQMLNIYLDGKEMKDVLTTKTNTHYQNTTIAAAELLLIKVDANGVITSATTADVTSVAAVGYATGASVSGNVVTLGNSGTFESYRVADNAVVYVYDAEDEAWKVYKNASAVKRLTNVVFYDTDEDVVGYEVVMAW